MNYAFLIADPHGGACRLDPTIHLARKGLGSGHDFIKSRSARVAWSTLKFPASP